MSELEEVAHRVAIVRGDDVEGMRSLLADQEVLLVSVGAPHAEAYEDTYLRTAKTLATVVPDLPNLKQILYTGSYAVYGDRHGDWVDETTVIAPSTPNAIILAETEQILQTLAQGDRLVCLFRLGGIYGPGRELLKIFRRAAGTVRPGTGEDASNWIHLDDIVGAIDFARQHRLKGLYNLVQDPPITVKALLDQIFQAHQLPDARWDATQQSPRPYNAKVSNQKLKNAGYVFLHSELSV
jgi:nucleoside-diphosphate-sugar epimerase